MMLKVYQSLTIAEGEAVDERQAVKPVVVLRVTYREKPRPIPQQGALQPGRDRSCRSKVTNTTVNGL